MLEYINKVKLDLTYYTGNDEYSDGSIEDELLEMVKNTDESEYVKLIAKDDRWPILYHLSKDRENILDGFYFSGEEDILEIGSGCGAITGCLAKKGKSVDCIELSKKRSLINAYKNKKYDNINIFVGNFNDIKVNKKYDVITLIGVLEYAQSYIKSSNPYDDFIRKVYKLLKPNGKLYIAIENKFGLKYFAGCKEDHTGKMFDGIENYYDTSGVRTFSYNEIKKLLSDNGFDKTNFYFPFPDYKLPKEIFSEKYLPKIGQLRGLTKNYDQDRIVLFNEELAFDGIIKSECLNIFSNSFLIEAIKEER